MIFVDTFLSLNRIGSKILKKDLMTIEIANSLFGYLETLYNLNQKLVKLCGIDAIDDFESGEKDILDMIQNIPRIIPYSFNKNKHNLELKERDGLLEYKDSILYLKDDYEQILLENYDFLDKIRKIRNKYEHKMHGVKHKSTGSGSLSLFDYTFMVEDESIEITSESFIKLIKSVNCLFSKIVYDISKFAYENQKEDYVYYRRITRFDFNDFNKIYDNDILRIVGKIMKRF